ncbi:integrin beta-PS-like [Bacillus rossius redtenbacheri]|uniref:integrin beta-PS-like n=1 Tax=Bacillus rossius redtenbacheri TaxID=93214 RepID=UPI002FDE1EAA
MCPAALLCLCLCLCLGGVAARDDGTCSSRETCGECLRHAACAWCGDPALGESAASAPVRCRARDSAPAAWCPAHLVDVAPRYGVLQNHSLSDSNELGQVVQLAPQRVRLRLRVGEPHELKLRYRHAKDYPVDLYYLMDLSASMKDDKESLSSLGDKLAAAMQSITTNFRLGFGSFVDKVAMPFTSTVPEKLINPCATYCAPPFGFRNNMPLTTDTKRFKTEVNKAEVSGNIDAPEGGLDALMQAVVCRQIGWRLQARRMVIFSSDATSHVAGDGRLAGIVAPNDGLCHLDEHGAYTASLDTDYPSIPQINQKARENNTNVIFAVTKGLVPLYRALAENIYGASVRELNKDSSNVVDLVVEEYKKLSDNVKLLDDRNEFLEVRYFSKCLNSSQQEETSECGGLKRGIEVAFTVNITATSCPRNAGVIEKQFLHISPVGINEKVTVELEIVCGCDCSKGNMNEANSSECSRHGDLECGLCRCHRGYLGDRCRCKSDSNSPAMEETAGCKDDRNETCSGHGTCVCNSCQCAARPDKKERYYGRLCECDNFSCKRHEGRVCADHGECSCGKCTCQPGWTGEACQCADTAEGCRRPGEAAVCSGRGSCECGQCVCARTQEGHHYSGQYCEECPSCPGALCKDFEVCAQCKLNDTKMLKQVEMCSKCGYITVVDNIRAKDEDDYDSYDSNQDKICPIADAQGCTLYFRYRFMDGAHRIWVQKERECGPNILGVIFGVIGATVFLGLLIILIWKILTTIHDKREYARFEKERELSKWHRDGNPLYQTPTSTFNNPTFKKS